MAEYDVYLEIGEDGGCFGACARGGGVYGEGGG